MLRGNWDGKGLGSGTDLWKYWTERCAGDVSDEEWNDIEIGIARSPGFCMTMGTASTMTALSEALGMTLPGASSIPAADSNHVRLAMDSGRRIVEMVWEDLKPTDILTPRRLCATPSPSTWPSAARPTPSFTWLRWPPPADSTCHSRASTKSRARVPVLANIRPSGEYLMEDFYYAGGLARADGRDSATCCTSIASPSTERPLAKISKARPYSIAT